MAFFYLIRHGQNDFLGKRLAGRLPGVHLNAEGKAEADRLADALGGLGIERLLSSPLERARETAEPLARRTGMKVEICEGIQEINFGDWAGKTMAELETSPEWKRFNTFRAVTRPPGGETMLEVQARMVAAIEECLRSGAESFALFSHGDPIRTTLMYFLGMGIDLYDRLEVGPGSYSILRLQSWSAQILGLNVKPGQPTNSR